MNNAVTQACNGSTKSQPIGFPVRVSHSKMNDLDLGEGKEQNWFVSWLGEFGFEALSLQEQAAT